MGKQRVLQQQQIWHCSFWIFSRQSIYPNLVKFPRNSIRAQSNWTLCSKRFNHNLPVCLHLKLWFSVWRWTDPLQSRPGNLPLKSKRQMPCYKRNLNFLFRMTNSLIASSIMWCEAVALLNHYKDGYSKLFLNTCKECIYCIERVKHTLILWVRENF